jgi:uncharacterized membrane protein
VLLRVAITILCGVGLYASFFMLRKSRLADRGLLPEPSVVQTTRARLLGPPNSALGSIYYPLIAVLVWSAWWFAAPALVWVSLGLAALAAAVSLVLAYSLLFVTRMPCPYCWTAHAVNWLLFLAVFELLKISY